MATRTQPDHLLSRREALGAIGVAGMTALVGCGGDSGSATPSTATQIPTGTATPKPSATATATGAASASATPPTATATTKPAATSTPTASPTPTPTPGALSCVVTPAETEGPYFVDVRLNRSDLTSGTTRPGVVNGLPLLLKFGVFTVAGNACTPLAGAVVDVWHADAVGVYSDEQVQNTLGETYLRGYQFTDQAGAASFTTIYPGWYPGRTVHVHFKVRIFSASGATTFEFTSQVFFDDTITDLVLANAPYNSRGQRDTRNANDMVYNTAGTAGARLLADLQPATSGAGYVASFTVGLQLS
jgi:protocatechuate 3,4-dioxygenase beta subunit